jgi:hypothetical protein
MCWRDGQVLQGKKANDVSRAQISGPKEMYIKAGSELRLACRVDLGPEGPDEHYRYLPDKCLFIGWIRSRHKAEC